jgi:uncharacterized protein YbjT (DUF2867 family)
MTVLMIGATGEFAGVVLPELKKRGAMVRALVQKQAGERNAGLRGADETAIGDLADVHSLVSTANRVDAVFLILPAFAENAGKLGSNRVEEYDQRGFSGGNALILPSILGREPPTFRHYLSELNQSERKAA